MERFENALDSRKQRSRQDAAGDERLLEVLDIQLGEDIEEVLLARADMDDLTPIRVKAAFLLEVRKRGRGRFVLRSVLRTLLDALFDDGRTRRPRVGPNRHWPRLLQYLRELGEDTDWSPEGRTSASPMQAAEVLSPRSPRILAFLASLSTSISSDLKDWILRRPAVHPHFSPDYMACVRLWCWLCPAERNETQIGCRGDTGENLNRILVYLNRHDPVVFPSTHRYDYLLANAFDTILFGDASMPSLAQVSNPVNLARLALQLKGIANIVALSAPAVTSVEGTSIRPTYRNAVHPGMRGLNNYCGLGQRQE